MPSKNSQTKDSYSLYDSKGLYKPGFAENNSGEIKTITGDSFTIRELLQKFTTGVLSPAAVQLNQEEVEYTDDMMQSEVPEFIDRTDVQQYIDTMNQRKKKYDSILRQKGLEAAKKQEAEIKEVTTKEDTTQIKADDKKGDDGQK